MIPFIKMHGLGNDFVLIDLKKHPRLRLKKNTIQKIGNRNFGVGFDQLLVVLPARRPLHARLVIYNQDGSRARMCGNGLRAVAHYIWKHWRVRDSVLRIHTASGVRQARRVRGVIECDLGRAKFLKRTPHDYLNLGNFHMVVFKFPRTNAELARWGARLENTRGLPAKPNVEFVRRRGPNRIDVRVWETGVGITQACGTGAGAAAAAARARGLVRGSRVSVHFPGGVAWIRFEDDVIWLAGPVEEVFRGIWY